MKVVVWVCEKELGATTALKCRLPFVWREFVTRVFVTAELDVICVYRDILKWKHVRTHRKVQFP